MEISNFNFKPEFVINYKNDDKTLNHSSRRSCKVLKFPIISNLDHALVQISRLSLKEFPNLFLFVIVTNDGINFDAAQVKKHFFNNFDERRPIIIQITSENGSDTKWFYRKEMTNQFVDLEDEHHGDCKDLSGFLRTFANKNAEEFTKLIKSFVENFSKFENSSTILRFMRILNVPDELFTMLATICALKGKKSDLLAILDASFEDDGRILSLDSQNILSETFVDNNLEISVLYQAVKNPNKDVVDYLISNCTHLIQQLPFEHRVWVSKTAQDLGKFGVLHHLLKYSDFPFPSSFDESSVKDKRIQQIVNERNQFHNAIIDKNENHVDKFVNDNWNLKLAFSTDNKSALLVAAESKNYDAFVKLKSLGFKAEEFVSVDGISCLSKREKKELSKKIWSQTQNNAVDAKLDGEKTVHLLRTRSCIHNRMINKDDEADYREKIRKMFENIYKIPLCSKFLDAASQCEDLKIIFDFESETVGDIEQLRILLLLTLIPNCTSQLIE